MQVSRRKFFKICAGGMAGTSAAMLGFAPANVLAAPREYKLLRAFESRNTCTYCAVSCGMLLYSTGKPYNSLSTILAQILVQNSFILKAIQITQSVEVHFARKVLAHSIMSIVKAVLYILNIVRPVLINGNEFLGKMPLNVLLV